MTAAATIERGDEPTAEPLRAQEYASRAEHARHGANQLSLSAQRAPTREACDEGWRRVESIVAVAEAAARAAQQIASKHAPGSAAVRAAQRAAAAAGAARRVVHERNDAYTFHTDTRFSFGEGWYVAAAGVLAGITIQIEPFKPATEQALRFLHDAGLASRLHPYRPRPRAVKQTTEIVARAFRADPIAAQRKLRGAFLGEGPVSDAVRAWVDRRLEAAGTKRKVLLWIRDGIHHPARNTTSAELRDLVERVHDAGLVPILVGEAPRDRRSAHGAIDMTLFRLDPIFQRDDARRAQLGLFEHARRAHQVIGQLGVTSAGMDGPALMGLPTMYLTDAPNVRMREWVGALPEYWEVVRDDAGYLRRVTETLHAWKSLTQREACRP